MASVFALLSLPVTSNGFTAIRSTVVDTIDDGSASPRRKTPRLDTDSDSASASRSRRSNNLTSPIKIEIRGDEFKKSLDNAEQHALLRRSLEIILTRNSPDLLPTTYEGVYTACRSIVTISNQGEGLYGNVRLELEKAASRLAKGLVDYAEEGMGWIVEFVRVCQWFQTQVALLESLMTYLDQLYVTRNTKAVRIRTLAYSLFTERIFENRTIAEKLRGGILDWVTWERNFRLDHVSQSQIPVLATHLIAHKQYSPIEEYYITITEEFYTAESDIKAQEFKDDPKAFFRHAQQRIDEEGRRSKVVLPVGSWGIVRETMEKALWKGKLDWLCSETVGPYLDGGDISTLAAMYTLFARVDGTKTLCFAFRNHVQTTVQNIVKDADKDETMVQRLLDFKALADKTVKGAFFSERDVDASTSVPTKDVNSDFVYALSDAFTAGFKARRNKPAEMIAKHLDRALRRGQASMSNSDFQATLDAVLALYRFTDDKDVFRTFYHRALAKRLLLQKSASDDFEKGMLKKLKEEYDPEFGMGEDMFKDLVLSSGAMADYHSKLDSQSAGLNLSVMVLQRSAWPFGAQEALVHLPPSMEAELNSFAAYYNQRHSGHVLKWDHALGTVTLEGRFNPGSKELSVSLFQAVVLLLFNNSTEIAYPDIKAQTGIEDAELRRTLQSLACGKKKVLKKVPPGRDVDDTDVFKFNEDFDDPRVKIHINSIQAKVSPEESKRTNVSIEGDRKHYLDAAIVRIMKARKELTYEQLKAATIDAVKSHFIPQVDAIKKRIDALVETDYLERSKEDKTKFLYVA